jgi:hypothetical protein
MSQLLYAQQRKRRGLGLVRDGYEYADDSWAFPDDPPVDGTFIFVPFSNPVPDSNQVLPLPSGVAPLVPTPAVQTVVMPGAAVPAPSASTDTIALFGYQVPKLAFYAAVGLAVYLWLKKK